MGKRTERCDENMQGRRALRIGQTWEDAAEKLVSYKVATGKNTLGKLPLEEKPNL